MTVRHTLVQTHPICHNKASWRLFRSCGDSNLARTTTRMCPQDTSSASTASQLRTCIGDSEILGQRPFQPNSVSMLSWQDKPSVSCTMVGSQSTSQSLSLMLEAYGSLNTMPAPFPRTAAHFAKTLQLSLFWIHVVSKLIRILFYHLTL